MWQTSSRCAQTECVRVSIGARQVWVGDAADDPAGQVRVISVARGDWAGFVAEVRAGRWDR